MKNRCDILILNLFLLISLTGLGQNETSKWHFGNMAALNFMTTPPSTIPNSLLNTPEGTSSVSDAAGNLLFYTDGVTVWNAANAIMANGTGLTGNSSSTQSALIVKQPGNTNIYFIFTVDGVFPTSPGVAYSIVDMNLAAGLGSVTVLNVPVAGSSTERLTGTKHCNGVDIWVLSQEWATGNFRANLVTTTGVNPTSVISAIGTNSLTASGGSGVGQMKFSPNGRKLGLAAANSNAVGFDLYDFDPSTGLVTNRVLLASGSQIGTMDSYGCEFSPDGTKFYGSLWVGTSLYQWDLCSGSYSAVANSQYSVACTNGAELQLAKNGKIYMAHPFDDTLGVINNPNAMDPGINYVDMGQSIAPNTSRYGLPNFVTSYFKPLLSSFTVVTNCAAASFTAPQIFQNYTVNPCTASGYSLTNMVWDFGDPASGGANTSALTNPTHFYSSSGTFKTKLLVYYGCGTDTIKQDVVIQPCINVVANGVSCSSPGSATVTATSGVGPYSYYWLPAGPSGPIQTGVYPGTYSVVVTDLGNNTSYTGQIVIVANTLSPAYSGTLSNSPSVQCFGNTTGTASILVSGGTGNQRYSWYNGTITFTTPSLTNLSSGNYTVTVTDAISLCALTRTFTITQPNSGTLSISASTLTACVGSNITFTASSSGGTPAYSYSWTGGPQSAINSINLNTGGNYVYTVTSSDANNCRASNTVQVAYVAMPIPVITSNHTTLCIGSNLQLNASGPGTYSWSGPNNVSGSLQSLTINNIQMAGAGIYSLTVTLGPCVATTTQSIVVHSLPTPSISALVVCESHNLQLNAMPGGAITFTWSGPANFTSQLQNPAIPAVSLTHSGIYSLSVTDINTCKGTVSLSVSVLPNPQLFSSGSTVCFGSPAVLTASGAVSYVWSGPNGFSSNLATATVPAAINTVPEAYTVIGTALNTCTSTAVVHVNTTPLPLPSLKVTPRACLNSIILFQASGGSSYQWKGPYNFFSTVRDFSFTADNPNQAGTYTLTAFDTLGCKASVKAPLQLDPLPQGDLQNSTPDGCIPFCSDFTLDKKTPAPIVDFSWEIGSAVYNTATFNYCFSNAGTYPIRAMLTDDLGCSNALTFFVNAHPLPTAGFDYFPTNPIEGVDPVNFINTSTGDDLITWNWSFINNPGYKTESENTMYTFPKAGVYPVAMVVKNKWGCMDTIVKTVTVESDFAIYMPNAFTPNSDQHNELFQAKGIGIKKYKLSVFNRWGQKIFETSDFTKGWDGTFNGKECKSDVYVWELYAANGSGKEKIMNGHVTLYR